jgi:hypothetical protein
MRPLLTVPRASEKNFIVLAVHDRSDKKKACEAVRTRLFHRHLRAVALLLYELQQRMFLSDHLHVMNEKGENKRRRKVKGKIVSVHK